jgi:hypothetical protein
MLVLKKLENKLLYRVRLIIPIQKMVATDNPTRPIGHPPRLRGGLGRGFIHVSHSFFALGITFAD